MKKLFILAVLAISVVMLFSTFALAEVTGPKSIDAILTEIRQEQGLNSTDKIDAGKVSAAKLEELGDAVMERIIGNSAMHERMDARLGGDGSTSLAAFHQRLGYNYLMGYPINMMSLMGGGMMGGYYRGGMMGGDYQGGIPGNYNNGSVLGSFGWVMIVFGVLLLTATTVIVILAIKIVQKPRS